MEGRALALDPEQVSPALVPFDDELRGLTRHTAERAHEIAADGATPPPVYTKQCKRCSFYDMCMPELLCKRNDVARYLRRMADTPAGEHEEGG